MPADLKISPELVDCSADAIDAIFERCTAAAPNYGVEAAIFKGTLNKIATKFLATGAAAGTRVQLSDFLEQLHAGDLFLATACAAGNERAWWEFDQHHRSYMERVARHLAKTDIDAQEVIDSVYGELYGTRVVDGERVSKFSTYSGRGSMRGWLRTVIWHSLVDLHRASHDEVSLDEMTENVGDGPAHASFAVPAPGGEKEMIARLSEDRYRSATLSAIGKAFGSLDNHEKLLLLYYHVENLKLREIARLIETEGSPLRGWFQRRASSREPAGRIHESTIMRWLEKSYSLVLKRFSEELRTSHALSDEEIDICMEMATSDLTDRSLFENLAAEGNSAAEI